MSKGQGICDACLCCNFETNPTSRNHGCAGLCWKNGHDESTPRDVLARMIREQLAEWDARDRRDRGA